MRILLAATFVLLVSVHCTLGLRAQLGGELSLEETGIFEWLSLAGEECLGEAGLGSTSGGKKLTGDGKKGSSVSTIVSCLMEKVGKKMTGGGSSMAQLAQMLKTSGPQGQKTVGLKLIKDLMELKQVELPQAIPSWDFLGDALEQRIAKNEQKKKKARATGAAAGAGADAGFYSFVPSYGGNVQHTGVTQFATDCFSNVSIEKKSQPNPNEWNLDIQATGQNSLLCLDLLLLSQGGGMDIKFLLEGTKPGKPISVKIKAQAGVGAEYMDHSGVMVFHFSDILDVVISFLQTFTLYFGPEVSMKPDVAASIDNALFFNEYVGFKPAMTPRFNGSRIEMPAAGVKSGDLFLVGRMLGSDTFMTFVQGTSIPHVAIVLCDDTSICKVCESRFQALWWPANGVQCNPLPDWLNYAQAGGLMVTHLPINASLGGSNFNSSAIDFFTENEGVDYAWPNIFYSGIDVTGHKKVHSSPNSPLVEGNFPCLPPDFSSKCFDFHLVEFLMGLLQDKLPSFAQFFGSQGWANRLSLDYNENIWYMFLQAEKVHNMTSILELTTMPELDSYQYVGLKDGATYTGHYYTDAAAVCQALKRPHRNPLNHLGDSLQCGEQVVWDILSWNLWDKQNAKQVLGDYTMSITPSMVGTRTPKANMGNKCPSFPPHYTRPDDC